MTRRKSAPGRQSVAFIFRLSPKKLAEYRRAARIAETTLSAFIRRAVDHLVWVQSRTGRT